MNTSTKFELKQKLISFGRKILRKKRGWFIFYKIILYKIKSNKKIEMKKF